MEMLMLSTWNEIPDDEKKTDIHPITGCVMYYLMDDDGEWMQIDVELERAPRPRR